MRRGRQTSSILMYRMYPSRMFQVSRLFVTMQVAGTASRAAGFMRRKNSIWSLVDLLTSSCGRFTELFTSTTTTRFRSKNEFSSLLSIDDTGFTSSMRPFAGYAVRSIRLCCLHGKGSPIRTPVIALTTSIAACGSVLHRVRVDGAHLLDKISSLDSLYGTCMIMNNTEFRNASIERKSVYMRMQREEYSPRVSHRTRP